MLSPWDIRDGEHPCSLPGLGWGMRALVATLLIVLLVAVAGALPGRAATPDGDLVKAELIAEPAAVAGGEPFWVGLRLRHQGRLARLLAQSRRFRRGRCHHLAAPAGIFGRPHRLADARAHPRRPSRQLRLRARDRAAHAHHAACRDERRHADRHQGRRQLARVPEGVHPGRGEPGAEPPVSRPRHRAQAQIRRPRAIFETARASLPQPAPWPAQPRNRTGPAHIERSREGPETRDDPIRLLLPQRRDARAPRGAAAAARSTRDGLTLRLERNQFSSGQPTDAGGVLVIEEALGGGTARQAFELANVRIGRRSRAPASAHLSPPSCRPLCSPCWAASSST